MSSERLITSRELAEVLQMPRIRLERMARAGQIPMVMLPGDEIRFVLSDIQEWIARHKVEPASA